MHTPRISAVVAVGKNRELGTENRLSWRIPEDFQRVKTLTTGHPIIMGRKTYESIGKPLPNRTNIVITRDENYSAEGCVVTHSLEEALEKARDIETEELFIFGGAQIYAEAFPLIERLYLTKIADTDPNADAFFPPYEDLFTEIAPPEQKTHDSLSYTWVTLDRIS